MATMSAEASCKEEICPSNDPANILLGVTGSVAAVKVPELICRLMDKFGPKVSIKVVLTQGGKNFWEKASTYDVTHWNKVKHRLENAIEPQNRDEAVTESKIQVYCKYSISFLQYLDLSSTDSNLAQVYSYSLNDVTTTTFQQH